MSIASEPIYAELDSRTRDLLASRAGDGRRRRRGWLIRRALVLADVVGLMVAFIVISAAYASVVVGHEALDARNVAVFLVSLPFWVMAANVYGLYGKDEECTDHSTADEFLGVFHLISVSTLLLYAASRQLTWFDPPFTQMLLFCFAACVAVPAARGAGRIYCRRQVAYLQNTLIIGAGDVGQKVAEKLLTHPEYGLNLVGFLDSNPKELRPLIRHVAVLGEPSDLGSLVDLLDVERVIVAFTHASHDDLLMVVGLLRNQGVQIDIVPRLFEQLGPSIGIHPIEGIPLISLPPARIPKSALAVKRVLDVMIAGVGICVLAPALIAIAIAVRTSSPGPIFYRHRRLGRGKAEIDVLKFRTMQTKFCRGAAYGGDGAEEEFRRLLESEELRAEFETTYKLRNDPRVTRVGAFLRRTSLDELPQLWNVLRGDLSLVGPRALTEDEVDRYYGDWAEDLLAIRPGITGYWQINGRSRLGYDDRVRLDLTYLRGWSLGLDLMILAKTARALLMSGSAV